MKNLAFNAHSVNMILWLPRLLSRRAFSMAYAILGISIFSIVSALVQLQLLAEIGVRTPASFALRVASQFFLFAPLIAVSIHFSRHRLIHIFLALAAVSYAHLPSPFFDYIWDVFLIETIFVYLASSVLLTKAEWHKYYWWPMRLLLFKLMFSMGVVKFLHGMPEWRSGLALKFFWPNQPMPGFLAWHAAQFPDWAQKTMVLFTFLIEVPGPFLIFFGLKARHIYFFANLFFQLGIFISGNYAFFNMLTIVLSISLLHVSINERESAGKVHGIIRYAAILALCGWLVSSVWYVQRTIFPGRHYLHETSWILLENAEQQEVAAPLRALLQFYAASKASNPYALFGMIPKYRMEIAIEKSADGDIWQKHEFRIKPETLNRPPVWYAPHHWRLDHQMYYESFRIRDATLHEQYSFFLGARWMRNYLHKIFIAEGVKFIRLSYLYYSFTDNKELKATGNYWKTTAPHRHQFFESIITPQNLDQLP